MDGLGQAVDSGSSLLNGKMGNIMTSKSKRTGKGLKTRLFPGSPYMGAGQSTLKNTDIKSKLMSGQNTHSNKAGGSLAGVYVNRFVLKNLIINDSKKINARYIGTTISCIFEVTIAPKVPSNIRLRLLS